MSVLADGDVCTIEMPTPETVLFENVVWGEFDNLFTAAFWFGQTRQAELLGLYQPTRLGRTLREELAACLLGGYGMKAEVGLAAYRRVRDSGFLETRPNAATIERALEQPFVAAGRSFKYRYPRQKARYLADCLRSVDELEQVQDDLTLRNRLMELPGIGPKTASWIVRNYRLSDRVAIIDIHILHAGQHIALFPKVKDVTRHYKFLEDRFLEFATAIDVRASVLDNVIWDNFRRLGHLLRQDAQTGTPEPRQERLALS